MNNVLITSISKKVPLVEAVRKAMAKMKSFSSIHGCDSNLDCIAKYGVDIFWQSPALKASQPNDIVAYCQKHHIQAIIPTRNEDVSYYSLHSSQFKAHGIAIMASSLNVVERCLDKLLFYHTLFEVGFPVIPSSLSAKDIPDDRCVVKEQFGAGAEQLKVNVSKEEAIRYSLQLKNPLFQPFVAGQEWSVDLYRSLHGKVMGVVARQRNAVEKGESQITTTLRNPALEELCENVAHFLNLYGHAVIQVIEDENQKFHIVECNPRFGGASTASLAVGLDSFYWFLTEALHQPIETYPFMRSAHEIRQVRHPSDWIFHWP